MTAVRKRQIIAPEASQENRQSVLSGQPEKDVDLMTPEHRKALARQELRNSLISVADKVAGDNFCYRNQLYPGAHAEYPTDDQALMRFTTRFYPYAVGGPLYVDEPKNVREVDLCEKKRAVMKKLKHRYCVIAKGYQTPDGLYSEPTTLGDAQEQLE